MKTIDVMEGDRWTLTDDGGLFQYRDEEWRGIYHDTRQSDLRWREGDNRLDCELDIPHAHAVGLLKAWGYTIAPGEGEKPECQQKSTLPVLTAERTEKPAPQENNSDEKSCFRDGVPVVDAVWVEYTIGKGSDAARCLAPYSNEPSARMCNDADFRCGKARIVRIRSVDEEARKDIDGLRDAVTVAYNNVCGRLSAIESRLAAEKPADKDAARVVKAPTFAPSRVFSDAEQAIIGELNRKWYAALAAVGVEYKESDNG